MVAVLMFTTLFADFAIIVGSPFLTASEVAQFGVCIKVAMLVGFAVQITHSLILPDLADAYAHRDRARVRPVLLRAAPFPVALSVLALIVTWIFGTHFLALFGDEFIAAQGPLLLLIACQALRAAAGPTHNLLMLEGAGKQNFWICMLAGSVLLIANALLAPMFGLWGSAEAAGLAYAVWIIAGAMCLHRLSAPRADLLGLLMRRQGARTDGNAE
jgi:O-antigen/teichoic acid export membrane protein